MHDFRPGARPAPAPASPSSPAEDGAAEDGDGVLERHGGGEDDGASVPLVTRQHADHGETVFDGDEEASALQTPASRELVVPYAHRDLKPGCVRSLFMRRWRALRWGVFVGT